MTKFYLSVLLVSMAISHQRVFATGSCSDNYACYSNGTTIALEEVKYDFPTTGQSTWFYAVNNYNSCYTLDDVLFKVGTCLGADDFAGGGTYTRRNTSGMTASTRFILGYTGNVYGIKYTGNIGYGTVKKIYITLNENLTASRNVLYINTGSCWKCDYICLPSSSCTPLPVELTAFTASENTDGHIELKWQTASEKNNSGFRVQHSDDGEHFTDVSFIISAHNSQEIRNYNWTDLHNRQGYYRLKIEDFDGYFEYSHVVYYNLIKVDGFTVFPTIVHDNLHIMSGKEKIKQITIIDINGNDVTDRLNLQQTDAGFIASGISLAPGYYMVVLNQSDRFRFYVR